MSNLSRTNICWKIRDTETGLFWSGFKSRCNHAIGTRFDRRSTLDDTVKRLWIHGARDGLRGFPLTWEVVEVELHETLRETMSGPDAIVDMQIEEHMGKIISARFNPASSEVGAGWRLFRQLRRKNEFEQWPFMALRASKFARWNEVKATMKALGVDPSRLRNEEKGWMLFADKEAAVAGRMADMLKGIGEVSELRIAFARVIGIPVERI